MEQILGDGLCNGLFEASVYMFDVLVVERVERRETEMAERRLIPNPAVRIMLMSGVLTAVHPAGAPPLPWLSPCNGG